MAGVGGTINTAVGSTMENAAKGSGADSADKSKAEPAAAAPVAKAAEPMNIADMQRRLAALGYRVGAAGGVMGKKAVDALKAFQKDNKPAVAGELNNETIARLRAAKSAG
jgi:peptidoglycan hydrolase-like protein with peptidoglycan-binding domain